MKLVIKRKIYRKYEWSSKFFMMENQIRKDAFFMPFVTLPNNIKLYYELYGSGTPIVFIHPTSMGLLTFKYQKPLSKHFKLLMYDLRGNGQSTHHHEYMSISTLSDDLYFLLKELKLKEVFICGYSNGGCIAQEFAIKYPDYVKGVILIGGFSEVNTFLLRTEFLLGILTIRFGGLPLVAKAISRAHAKSKAFYQELECYINKSDKKMVSHMYQIGLDYVATNRLQQIEAPLLLVYGQKDYYVHSYQYAFQKYVKNVEVVYVSNVKHQVPTLKGEELNAIIHQFVDKNK